MKILVTNQDLRSPVVLLPKDALALIEKKHEVFFTRGLGKNIYIDDQEYLKVGAKIVHKLTSNLINKMDLVLSFDLLKTKFYQTSSQKQVFWCHGFLVNHPTELLSLLKNNQTVVSCEAINEDGLFPYSLAYEQLKGTYGVNLVASALAKTKNNPFASGLSLNSIGQLKSQTTFLILNHSYASYFAAKTALGLGANVVYLDNDLNNLKELKKDHELKTLAEVLKGSINFDSASYDNLNKYCAQANVLITSNPFLTQKTPMRITNQMLNSLKAGGVYLDLAAESGNSCETTGEVNKNNKHPDVSNHIKQIVLDNIPSLFPLTTSQIFSDLNKKYLLELDNNASLYEFIKKHPTLKTGIITANGKIINEQLAKSLNLNYQKLS